MKIKLLSLSVVALWLFGCDMSSKPKFDPYAKDENGLLTYSYCPSSINEKYKCYSLTDKAWIEDEYSYTPVKTALDNHGNLVNVFLFSGSSFDFLSNLTSIPLSNELVAVGGAGLKIQRQQSNSEQWQLQYYSRFSNSFRDVHFVDENLGFAVGGKNDIFRTQNGGKTWQNFNKLTWKSRELRYDKIADALENEIYDLGFNSQIYSVTFNTKGQGVVVGENGLIYSDNNGQTWLRVKIQLPEYHALQEVTYSDNSNVWAVGIPNIVLNSTNGGKNWHQISITSNRDKDQDIHFMSVDFSDPQHGCVVGNIVGSYYDKQPMIFCTNNAGINWVKAKLEQTNSINIGDITRLKMRNNLEGWMVSDQGVILNTTDGGLNWQVWFNINASENQSPYMQVELWGLTLLDDKAYAVGRGYIQLDPDIIKQLKKVNSSKQLIEGSFLISWPLDSK